ncbi:MAG: L-threonylcarbamoyladenylate synthase [Anaerolineae bacterium]
MTYRLIVADLDGTLMGDDLIIPDEVVEAVQKVKAAGLYFTIATGRSFVGVQPFIRQLGVNAPVILYQGAEIREPESGEAIYQACIPLEWAHELIAFVKEAGIAFNVFLEDLPYAESRTPETDLYEQIDRVPVQIVGDMRKFLQQSPTKIMLIGEPAQLAGLTQALQQWFAGRLRLTRSHRHFLEAVPLGANKARGLARLARHLGIMRHETVALGDNDNDADMLSWAGLGIALDNASPSAKQAADVIAPSVERAGAAWAIHQLVMQDQSSPQLEGLRHCGAPTRESPLCPAGDPDCIVRAVEILHDGGVVAFPTDTVYGLAADARQPDAVAELYIVKRRAPDKAIPILIADPADLRHFVSYVPEPARRLMEAFWPGGLTLILPIAPTVPAIISPGPGIAVRMPNHPVPLELIRRLGAPLATTSANISGAESPSTAQEVLAQLGRRVDLILDGGPTPGPIPSTIVDFTQTPPRLLRAGALQPAEIRRIIPDLVIP